MAQPVIGILGGSGLYSLEGLSDLEEVRVETPFGDPSDLIMRGELAGATLCFLPRHGRGHRFLPHEINYRANIYALKKLGVDKIISISAVGSMKEALAPGHIVIPDQFFDRTTKRDSTFFGEGCVAHVSFGDPVCPDLAAVLTRSAQKTETTVHSGGVYLNMEGPQFSTRGESNIYRSWGVSVIGMTNVTEAKLAREAEIAYATVAMVTDYDCWHEEEVSVEAVIATLRNNVATAKQVLRYAVEDLVANPFVSRFSEAMKGAVMTPASQIPASTREKLDLLIGKYL